MTVSGIASVKHKILVLSGKGGVGKSTVATQLAFELASKGLKVGLLDVDICGPSAPKMFHLEGESVMQSSDGWVPVPCGKVPISVMSIGFLLKSDSEAVVWRGPKKHAIIKQFIDDCVWGELDYLIIDTPPGTSDEHMSTVESLKSHRPDGAVVVTTPQTVAVNDVRKELNFCAKLQLPVIGVVENMSGFVCTHCDTTTNIFSVGGGEKLASEAGCRFLGKIPLDPRVGVCGDSGERVGESLQGMPVAMALTNITNTIREVCEKHVD